MKRELNIETLQLKKGAHKSASDGMCLLEAASYIAGEPFSDRPACVCPVIASLGRSLNDRIIDDYVRTELLRPLLPKLLNTAGSRELRMRRAYAAADAAVHIFAPMALDSAKKPELAAKLRNAPEITDKENAIAARGVARDVKSAVADAAANAAYAAYAAYDAAAYAAYDAAYDVADAAANAAYAAYDAYDAVADAAAAANAAYDAAYDAAANAAYAAYDAAYDVADAAYAAYDAAAYAAYDAANAAAYADLRKAARLPVHQAAVRLIEQLCEMKEQP